MAILYFLTPQGFSFLEMFIWFDIRDGECGTIFWSNAQNKRKVPHQSLPLAEVSDVYLGNDNDFWQSLIRSLPPPQIPPEEQCFSLLSETTGKALHLVCDARTVEAWAAGIKELTSDEEETSMEVTNVMLDTAVGVDAEERRLSDPVSLQYIPPKLPATPLATMQAIMSDDQSISELDSTSTLQMMQNGQVFTVYQKVAGTVRAEKVRLFWLQESLAKDGPLGSLYWCEQHLRIARPSCRFDLAMTDEIILGKLTPALTHASGAVNSRCFSLMHIEKDGRSLDLEAESEELLCCWLFGINELLDNESEDGED